MTRPLPSDFHLTESEFVTLKQQVQILETKNEHVKSVLILIFCSGIHGVIYLTVAWSVWRETGAWVLLGILPLFFSVLFWSAAIAGALGPKPKLLKPFLREPDERIKRYQLFQDAESRHQIWDQRTQENFWNSLSGAEFEREVVNLLHRVGFIAQLTAGLGDRGVDIVLDGGEIIVQSKLAEAPAAQRCCANYMAASMISVRRRQFSYRAKVHSRRNRVHRG